MSNDKLYNLIWTNPTLACYEGDDGDGGGDDGGGDPLQAAEAAAQAAAADAATKAEEARKAADAARQNTEKTFSQADVNTFLAEDKRKQQEKFKKLEDSYKKILADTNLQKEQRAKLEAELQDVQASQRTAKQQAEYERKQEREQFTTQVETLKEQVEQWETLFKSSVVDRSLQDAAIAQDAFNPSQIMGLLRPMTRMQEKTDESGNPVGEFAPVIDFADINEASGEPETTLRTPEQAVQRMKELPQLYGNLFRSNVVSGVGSGSATGGVKSGEGRIDPTKLSPEDYRRLRKENPEALGLKRRTR
jgi:hypothetical protein